MPYDDENKVEGIVLLTDDAKQYLNSKQETVYKEHRRELAKWLLNLGKTRRKLKATATPTLKPPCIASTSSTATSGMKNSGSSRP
ncbi:MAG: hypothetical protein ABEJ72_01070 [Candidatus Aenigmatarchaeota archaeon]